MAVLPSAEAAAQALDIDHPEIKAGEREVRSVNIVNGGYRSGLTGEPRSSHEIGAGYAPTDWFKAILHVDLENLIGEEVIADHVGFESIVSLRKAGEDGGLALGWYTGLMVSTDRLSTNSLILGPIIKLSQGKASLTLNPYIEDTFGRNAGPGLNALYGWQARYEFAEGVSVGVEGFGMIGNLGDIPAFDVQDHRVGPGLFLSFDVGSGREYLLDVGLLAGVTDAAPDATLKINFGSTF
jgi:hypothetical protein